MHVMLFTKTKQSPSISYKQLYYSFVFFELFSLQIRKNLQFNKITVSFQQRLNTVIIFIWEEIYEDVIFVTIYYRILL